MEFEGIRTPEGEFKAADVTHASHGSFSLPARTAAPRERNSGYRCDGDERGEPTGRPRFGNVGQEHDSRALSESEIGQQP